MTMPKLGHVYALDGDVVMLTHGMYPTWFGLDSEGEVVDYYWNTKHRPRPLVVIDPEDREQVERLANCIRAAIGMTTLPSRTELERGLREFANPPTVFDHYPANANETVVVRSLCGKAWKPNPSAVSQGKCPDCVELVESRWVR